jgi:hypothetical protein
MQVTHEVTSPRTSKILVTHEHWPPRIKIIPQYYKFHTYVDSIYPNELEIKDTTECYTPALYLDILLKLDTNGKITTQFYDEKDDFNFSIVNFPFLCSNILISPAYGIYISQLI